METSKTALWATETKHEYEKRFKVPGVVLKSNCPHCGKECTTDLGSDYINYAKIGKNNVDFYHDDETTGDGHAWDIAVELIIGIRVIPPQAST